MQSEVQELFKQDDVKLTYIERTCRENKSKHNIT